MNFSFQRTRRGDDAIIKQVIELADSNKKTLGFLPASAIEERCQNGSAFVCMQGDKLVAYILFSHLKRTHIIRIHHFCVDKARRRGGLATTFFNKFKETLHGAFYIELSCRDDYGLNGFWNSLGFNIVQAREGRAVNELSVLHLFRCPLQKNLLDIIDEIDTRPKVLLDSSIVFNFEFDINEFTENNSLLAYSNDTYFCIAPVIFEDIQRQQDDDVKLASINKANKFKTLPLATEDSNRICAEILSEFPQVKESDRRQLACAIVNQVKCFVTNDRQLLGLVQPFADNYNVMIYSPAEFYLNIDSVLNREVSQTEQLPSTHGKLVDIRLDENALINKFLNTAKGEKRHEFVGKLQKNLKNSTLKSIVIADEEYGVIYYAVEQRELTVHLLRMSKRAGNFAGVATTFILREMIQIATRNGVALINLDDAYTHPHVMTAGEQLGFSENKKLALRYIGEQKGYPACVEKALPGHSFSAIQSLTTDSGQQVDIYTQVEVERNFFPSKFTDIDIPSYIIPIRPLWARDLITPQVIGQYGLFTPDTGNVLMHDTNVYYTGTKAHVTAPSRILWYMTDNLDKNAQVIKAKHIIASSYLDEVHIGTKEDIFKKFWKIGVYKWADISEMPSEICTAIIFSRTEIFINKIPYKTITDIVRKNMNKGMTPISVTPISKGVFFEIYEQGHRNGHA